MRWIKEKEMRKGHGYSINIDSFTLTDKETEKFVVWVNVDTGKIDSCWGKDGMVIVGLEGKEWNEATRKEIETHWLDIFTCEMCGKKLKERKHSHFAGVYCDECWEKYKAEHSRRCMICGQPEWACHC